MKQTQAASRKMTTKDKVKMGAKFFFVIGAFIFMVFNTIYGLANPVADLTCVYDSFFVLSKAINSYLAQQMVMRKCTLIFSSLLVDGMILSTLVHWCFYGKSFRFFFSFLVLYVFHIIVRLVYFVEIPCDSLWEYPGFPSIFVSYLKTTSMFFCNHIGLLMLCLLEWKTLRKTLLMSLSLVLIVLESGIMIVYRGNYIIDILSGLLFGHYFFILVKRYVKGLDEKIKGLRKKAKAIPLTEEKSTTDTDG